MPTFVAVHTWNKDKFVTVCGKVLNALAKLPKDVTLCASYVYDTGAWCVYTAGQGGETQIRNFLTTHVPDMTTNVTPVLTFFPPTPEIYPLIGQIMQAMSG